MKAYVFTNYFIMFILIFFSTVFIPYFTRKNIVFGVSIPEDEYTNAEIKELRNRYRNENIVLQGIVLLISIGLMIFNLKFIFFVNLGSVALQLIIMAVTFLIKRRKMLDLKAKYNWFEDKAQVVVVDMQFRNKKYRVSPLWFISYFIIMVITLAVGYEFYDRMPKMVPMNYGLDGEVTRYAKKSFKIIFFGPAAQLFTGIMMVFAYYIIGKAKQQIDASKPEASIEQNRLFRYRWSVYIIFMGAIILGTFLIMQLNFVGILKNMSVPIITMFAMLVLVTIPMVILSVKTGQGGSRININTTGDKGVVNRDDDKYWKLGVFYYNPNDPAVFVEKRFGIGWTNNWARPLSWVFIIGIFALLAVFAIVSKILAG